MTTNIEIFLKYANVQLAGEALYGLETAAPGTTFFEDVLPALLTTGNSRSSRFTTELAQQFVGQWTIVEHVSNITTGFSGTLFRDKGTGKLVLSFRSTEFADDAARDNQATNALEITEKGWAFGQIDDMETWFSSLRASGKLEQGAQVTGDSLGGHLATASDLLHAGDLAALSAALTGAIRSPVPQSSIQGAPTC